MAIDYTEFWMPGKRINKKTACWQKNEELGEFLRAIPQAAEGAINIYTLHSLSVKPILPLQQ